MLSEQQRMVVPSSLLKEWWTLLS